MPPVCLTKEKPQKPKWKITYIKFILVQTGKRQYCSIPQADLPFASLPKALYTEKSWPKWLHDTYRRTFSQITAKAFTVKFKIFTHLPPPSAPRGRVKDSAQNFLFSSITYDNARLLIRSLLTIFTKENKDTQLLMELLMKLYFLFAFLPWRSSDS